MQFTARIALLSLFCALVASAPLACDVYTTDDAGVETCAADPISPPGFGLNDASTIGADVNIASSEFSNKDVSGTVVPSNDGPSNAASTGYIAGNPFSDFANWFTGHKPAQRAVPISSAIKNSDLYGKGYKTTFCDDDTYVRFSHRRRHYHYGGRDLPNGPVLLTSMQVCDTGLQCLGCHNQNNFHACIDPTYWVQNFCGPEFLEQSKEFRCSCGQVR